MKRRIEELKTLRTAGRGDEWEAGTRGERTGREPEEEETGGKGGRGDLDHRGKQKSDEKITDRLGRLEKRLNTSKCDKSTQDGFVLPGEGRLHLINDRAVVLSAVQVDQDVFKIRN